MENFEPENMLFSSFWVPKLFSESKLEDKRSWTGKYWSKYLIGVPFLPNKANTDIIIIIIIIAFKPAH
jgi:hypothetical protein